MRDVKCALRILLFFILSGNYLQAKVVSESASRPVKKTSTHSKAIKGVKFKRHAKSFGNTIITSTGFPYLCPDATTLTLSASPAPANASYKWFDAHGTTLSTAPTLDVSETGPYGLFVNGVLYPTIVINAGVTPAPSFTHSADNQCTTVPVQFNDTSPGGPYTYLWDFDDPNSAASNNSTSANPSHLFVGTPGDGTQTFNVTLLVTDKTSGCKNTVSQQVNVLQPADTKLIGTGYQGNLLYNGLHFFAPCTNSPTQFTFTNVSTTTNTHYTIQWGDGSPDFNSSGFVSTTHNYNLGTNFITYTVTDINGCVTTQKYLVYVGGTPAIGLQSNTNASICTGDPLTINVTGAANNPPGTTYVVTFSDGSLPETYTTAPATIVHKFTKSSYSFTTPDGQYTNAFNATIKATNPCSSASAVVEPIYVSDKPTALIDVAGQGGGGTTGIACVGTQTIVTNLNASNYYVAANGNGLQNNSIWTISPSTYTILGGSLGSTNGQDDDPSQWTSGDASLNIQFDQPGNYTFTLVTANPIRVGLGGCGSDQVTKTVCVNPFPVAAFIVDKNQGCGPLTVKTTNNSNVPTCGNNTYQWKVDYDNSGCVPNSADYTYLNGTDPTSANPQIIFNTAGQYTLTLVTTSPGNGCISDPVSQVITVKAKPIVDTAGITQSICQYASITPTSSATNCYSASTETYLWTFAGGTPSTSTLANPGTITYNTAGNFKVTLAVSNECGTTTLTQQILVNPAATVNKPGPFKYCDGAATLPILFSGTGTGTVFTWVNDNPSIGLDPSGTGDIAAFTAVNTGSTPQIANITVTPENDCTGLPVTFTITVNPQTSAPVTAGSFNYCVNDIAAPLTATAIQGNTLKWYTNAALTGGTTTAPVPATTTAGNYLFYVTQTNNSGCESVPVTITVTVNPAVTNNIIGSDQNLCAGTAISPLVSVTPVSGGDGNFAYQWQSSIDNGTTWNNINLATADTYSPGALAGITKFRRLVSSGSCQNISNVITVTVQGTLTNFDIAASQTICNAATPALLKGQTPAGGSNTFTYQWESSTDNSNWTSIINATLIDYQPPALTATSYYRRVVTSGICTGLSSTVTVTVNPVATVVPVSDQFVCNGASVPVLVFASTPATNTTFGWISDNTAIGLTPALGQGDLPSFTATNSSKLPITANITVTPTYTANGVSCTGTPLTFKITVLPTISVSNVGNTVICAGSQVPAFTPVPDAAVFANSSVSYTWSGGTSIGLADGAGNQVPAFTATNSGVSDLAQTITLTPVYNYNGTSCAGVPTSYIITVNPKPTPSNAGPDDKTCATSYQLNGNVPVVGTGTWTLASGPAIAFANKNAANTTVTGLLKGTEYQFTWSIANNTCAVSSSTVKIDLLSDIINTIKPSSYATCSGQAVTIGTDALSGGDVPGLVTASYTYLWESSADGLSGWQVINGATKASITVNPGVVTYYRRTVSSLGQCPTTSNVIQIIISAAAPAPNAGTPLTLCAQTQAQLNGNNPGPGFTGTWTEAAQGSTLTFTPNANTYNATVNGLVPGTNYKLVWTIVSPSCGANSATLDITNLPPIVNQIGPAITNVCFGQPVTITGAAATGGAGNYQYSWESSPDGITWSVINGESGLNITLTPTASLLLRRNVISGTCNLESNTVTISVQPALSNNIITGAQQVCTGKPPLPINGSNPAGGDGIYTYQWQESITPTDAASWTNSANGTVINYTPGALTTTTYYRRIVSSALCTGVQSNTSAYIQVLVNPDAKAEFTATKQIGCAPFNLQSVINVLPHDDVDGTYEWYANGTLISTSSSSAFPAFTIPANGQTYTIKLVAISKFGCTSDEVSLVFSTLQDVSASFTTTPINSCGNQTLNFTNTTTPITGATYAWDFGNGQTSTLTQPGSILFTQAKLNHDTTYTITLIASTGCTTSTYTNTITIKPALKSIFTPDVTIGCSPLAVNFSNQSRGVANQYIYDFGDGTTQAFNSNQAVQHTYTVTKITKFTVQLTAQNECGTDVTSYVIEVSPNTVTANLVVNGDNKAGCAPYTVTFYNNSVGANLFSYNFKDGSKASQTTVPDSIKHTFTKPGIYNVSLTSSNGCSTDSTIETITILEKPVVKFTSDKLIYCVGDDAKLTNNSTPNTGINYAWDFGDGNTSTQLNTDHVFATAGKYTIKLTASQNTTAANCSVADSITVTVLALPKAVFTSNNGSLNCAPFTLSVNSQPTDAVSVSWLFDDPTSTTNTVTGFTAQHVFTKPGTYNVKMTALNLEGCPYVLTQTLVVSPSPSANFTVTNNLNCAPLTVNIINNSINADGYQWYLDNKLVSTDKTPLNIVLGQSFKSHQLKLVTTGVNGCNADSVVQTIGTNATSNLISPAVTVVCFGQPVTITGTATPNIPILPIYIWESTTDGSNWTVISGQSGQNITFTPTASINLRRHLVSGTCDVESDTISIRVQPPLSNNVISAAQQVCIGQPTAPLAGTAPGGGDGAYRYLWQQSISPADPASWVTTVNDPAQQNYIPGILNVTTYYRRIVTSALCTGPQSDTSKVIKIQINPGAKAEFNNSQQVGCAPFNLQNVIDPVAHDDVNGIYKWYANGVLISTSTHAGFPSFIINKDGITDTIKLVTISKFGCSSDSVSTVFSTVKNVVASFTKTPVTGCGSQNISFKNTSAPINGGSYFWDFGNGQTSGSIQPGAVLFNPKPLNHDTTYTITLTVINGCDINSFRDSVIIRPKVKAEFTPDKTTGCSPFVVNINNQSSGTANQYTFDFGDGSKQFITGNQAIKHTYITSKIDTFTVKLTARNACGMDSSSYKIVVFPSAPLANLVVNGNNKTGCAPYTVTFYNNSTGANLFNYDFNDGSTALQTSTPDSVKYTFTRPGIYNVKLTASNPCLSVTSVQTITVLALPKVSFAPNQLQYCVKDTAVFKNKTTLVASPATISYFWNFGDGMTSSDINPKHAFASAGKYTVKLTAFQKTTTANCDITDSVQVTVLALPASKFTSNFGNVNCTPYLLTVDSRPTNAVSVSWIFDDLASATNFTTGFTSQHTFNNPAPIT